MAHKVTIECEARFVDHLSDDSKKASDSINDIGSAAEKAQKKVNNLGKKKSRTTFDADDSKFLKKIRAAEDRAKKFGKTKTLLTLKALDKASSVIGKALNKARSFGGKVWSGILKIKDSQAMNALGKVTSMAKGIAGKTWSAIVKIKDYATTPLKKIKDSLFSIKSLIAAVTAGFAAKQFVINPISTADAYSSAKIGFSTLLGDKAGQQMMDDLDAFAKKSPFDTSGVISNAQKMLAMGWDAESIVGDMEVIGNAAASTGNLNQGLESIVRAMSQIKTKGKLSAEELNQLAEAGISAKAMLAEELGYGSGDAGLAAFTKDQEKGLIGADKALEALLSGMKKYDGMMDSMANETASGLLSQLKDVFEVNIVRKWGQGLQDGAKRGFGTLVDLLDNSEEALSSLGDTLYNVGKAVSNWAADKLERAVKTIKEVTGTDMFKNASLGGKIKILWNEVIAEPFSEWWNSEGKAKFAAVAGDIGKGLGAGITGGLCALLGFDATGALADGISIGGSFMDGFLEGFDTDRIGEALKNWVNDNKGLATALGVLLAGKLISGIGNVFRGGQTIWNTFFGGKGGSGGSGGTLLSNASAGTMNVTAGVVNVYGFKGFGGGGGTGGGTTIKGLLTGGKGTKALPGGNSTVKGLLTGGGGTAAKTLTGVTLKNGTIATTGSAATAGLANVGVSLGSGATTAGGAALAGGGAILGGVMGAIGLVDAGVDLAQGIKANKSGDKKGAKDKFVTSGTKAGMVGAGAGIGAAVGSVIPVAGTAVGALVGAGVGGVAALLTGDKAGKAISDGSDEGGWLSNAWEATKEGTSKFFTETLPNGWNSMWDSVGSFFTETIPSAWGTLTEKVGGFFTETIPNAWNSFWDSIESFFTETVPYALGFATGKVVTFFSETIPNAWNSFWDAVGTFFTETIPSWADTIWNGHVVPFFTETLPQAWDSMWEAVGSFFTETVPAWADTIWNGHIVPFFTETLPAAWDSMWEAIGTFFTETIPEWADSTWNNNIVPFFTESIPGFFGSIWDSVCGFFNDSIDFIAEKVWAPIKGFFTETIPGWASSAVEKVKGWWNSIKENFTAGFESGSGGGGGKKARGGIVGGGSSSMEAFARGGRTDGGVLGRSTRWIRVNEESPEMIIPLSSQRRERAMKLWAKTGQLLGVPGFARGGRTSGENDEGIRFHGSDSDTANTRSVMVNLGGIHIELKVEGTDRAGIVQAIKEQLGEIAESVAGMFADEFEALFENTPVRGEVT